MQHPYVYLYVYRVKLVGWRVGCISMILLLLVAGTVFENVREIWSFSIVVMDQMCLHTKLSLLVLLLLG